MHVCVYQCRFKVGSLQVGSGRKHGDDDGGDVDDGDDDGDDDDALPPPPPPLFDPSDRIRV